MNPVNVPFAEYAPDLSDYSPQFSDAILNVEPTQDGYIPLNGFDTIGTGLGAATRGACFVRKTDGTADVYAGTATKLYRYNSGTLAFDDVTRSSGGDYSTEDIVDWSFVQYGTLLVATNGIDDVQYIDVDSGTNFAALSNAPKAYYVAVVGDHLLLGALYDDKRKVAWSGVNDATFWTYGQRGSDQQLFPDGGFVKGLVGQSNGAVIFQDDKIRTMDRVGGNLVFAFRVLHEAIGCFSSYSIIPVRNTFYWYSQGGFYEGPEATPIGEARVNNFVRKNSNAGFRKVMRGAQDPNSKLVWWLIQDTDDSRYMLGFDYVLRKWTRANMDVDCIFGAIPAGYTIDGIATVAATMDEIPYPFDSAFWQGSGVRTLAGFNGDGDFGFFQATPLAATIETHDIELSPGAYSFVNSMRLIGDPARANVTGKLACRRYPGADLTWSDGVTPDESTGRMWFRKRGQTFRARIDIAASDWNNVNGVMMYAKGAGRR